MNKQESETMKRFVQACECLTPRLQNMILHVADHQKQSCEEIRLRAGFPPCLYQMGSERAISSIPIGAEELREIISRATRYSVHSYSEALAQGYLPLQGGHRLGICGTAIVKNGEIAGIRTISSLNLRVAHPQIGAADEIAAQIIDSKQRVKSTLILSPPGFGKTTVLRDLIRQISRRDIRVGIADERGELAAMDQGIAQFDVGPKTDVFDQCPKAQGIMLLLKTMSPDVVALDEITSSKDTAAIAYAGHCGVSILATAHAASLDELQQRPLYSQMMDLNVFEYVVTIEKIKALRKYRIERIGGT